MAITILGKDVTNISIDEKEVIRISDYLTGDIIFEKVPVNYFYIQNTYSGTNTITITSTSDGNPSEDCFTRVIEYSRDRRIWTAVALAHQVQTTITLSQNDKVYFRNSNGKLNYDNTVDYFYTTFTASESHIVGGNIESLVDYRNIGRINYRFQGTYSSLFRDNTTLTSASGLIMPENNLSAKCMSDMFRGCTALTAAPELPAKTLSKSCYLRMFAECSSLTETPELPATSVQDGVYWSMFRNCTSLVTTHDLELKVLTNDCYNNMFYGCTSLVDAPEIYAQVYGKNSCENMFRSCTSLSSMHVNADDATATDCTKNWLQNVASSGTFYNYGSVIWDYPSPSGIPQGWQEVIPKDYFYIENTYNGTNTITLRTDYTNYPNSAPPQGTYATSVEYSKDMANWTTINFTAGQSYASTITMDSGEKVYFRNDSGYFNYVINGGTLNIKYYITSFSCDKSFIVGGNLCSLLDYNNMISVSLSTGCFASLFKNNYDTLTGAGDLILDKNTLSHYCYANMFSECHNLTSIPELPAKNLAEKCYYNMFRACTHLNVFPELPATTLADYCYAHMFQDCDRFASPVVLPAKTLVKGCYSEMFYTSRVNDITSYADDISAEDCLFYWLSHVSATGTFHNLGSATYSTGASGIPSGWTVVYS